MIIPTLNEFGFFFSIPVGYQLAVVPWIVTRKAQAEPFTYGWMQNEKEVNGRSVDVQFLKDGSLLMSDDYNGVIYKIMYHF